MRPFDWSNANWLEALVPVTRQIWRDPPALGNPRRRNRGEV